MGGEKTTTEQSQQSTATPEEKELNKLALERARASQEGLLQTQDSSLNLVNQLLLGEPLPGYLGSLPGGLSESSISNIVGKSLNDVNTNAQSLGILDSGTAAELGVRTSSDIRANAEQFNLQNLMQLLNLGVGGQAQVQSPILGSSANLGQRLAGLRSTNASSTTTAMNPFLKNFQSSLGTGLGTGVAGGIGGALGGAGGFSTGFGNALGGAV